MGAAVLLSYIEQFGTQYLSRVIIGDMSPKPLNDDKWKLGLYQGWYTESQLEADLQNMENDYKKFAILFAEQTIFPHTPNENRNFDVTPDFVQAVYDRAEAEGKSIMLSHFMEVEAGNAHANRVYWETCDQNDYRPALEKIDVPAALLYADPGSIYDPQAAFWMAAKIPDVKLYCLEGCTHMASAEKPEEFIEAIVDFAAIA
jgi:pimeloyl-ACP methyl ester carboxylesterase